MLGDTVQLALEKVGITQQRVKDWLGDCCCDERKEMLNRLDVTCRRILAGKLESGRRFLETLLEK